MHLNSSVQIKNQLEKNKDFEGINDYTFNVINVDKVEYCFETSTVLSYFS